MNSKKRKKLNLARFSFKKFSFFWLFAFIMILFFSFLFNFVPVSLKEISLALISKTGTLKVENPNNLIVLDQTLENNFKNTDRPSRLIIPEIGLNEKVFEPASLENDDLEVGLLDGIIYHPSSNFLDEAEGNVLFLGHSTALPIVLNQSYKVFNNLKNLKQGHIITVVSRDNKEYYYVVINKMLVAEDRALIVFEKGRGRGITLITCNPVGQKSDRYAIEAEFLYQK